MFVGILPCVKVCVCVSMQQNRMVSYKLPTHGCYNDIFVMHPYLRARPDYIQRNSHHVDVCSVTRPLFYRVFSDICVVYRLVIGAVSCGVGLQASQCVVFQYMYHSAC